VTKRDEHGGKRVTRAVARRRAETYRDDPERARRLAEQVREKADRQQGRLAEVWQSLMTLQRLVRAWASGRYRRVPWRSIALAIAALIYFLMPLDVMPDWLIGVGFIDDASFIAFVVKSIQDDLDNFLDWETQQGEAWDP
jgi:uncharacterized membrane protein YkvA (DUF1232 family)